MKAELEAYIESHIEKEPEHLRRLEKQTNLQRINGRMCSGHIQGRLLKMLTQMIDPDNALELGTFTGYSALCIAEGMRENAMLTTVELEDELEEPISRAFGEGGFKPVDKDGIEVKGLFHKDGGPFIRLCIDDALNVCRSRPDGSFDLIFIDADKRQYPDYYREAVRLLRPGGYIIADNTLWDGHVAETGRHDPQTEGVREFNRFAATDPGMQTVIIPLRDGLSLIHKPNGGKKR